MNIILPAFLALAVSYWFDAFLILSCPRFWFQRGFKLLEGHARLPGIVQSFITRERLSDLIVPLFKQPMLLHQMDDATFALVDNLFGWRVIRHWPATRWAIAVNSPENQVRVRAMLNYSPIFLVLFGFSICAAALTQADLPLFLVTLTIPIVILIPFYVSFTLSRRRLQTIIRTLEDEANWRNLTSG